jgi:ArsR family transcriptional regulator
VARGDARQVVAIDVALALLLEQRDELRGGVQSGPPRVRISTGFDIGILTRDIDTCQYGCVKRLVDPDALLLQGAADPTRLAILRQLADGDGVCACDFTACCDVAQPTVSHHLKVLRESGWVRSERRGSNVWYWLRPEAVERFRLIAGELAPSLRPTSARSLRVLQPAT